MPVHLPRLKTIENALAAGQQRLKEAGRITRAAAQGRVPSVNGAETYQSYDADPLLGGATLQQVERQWSLYGTKRRAERGLFHVSIVPYDPAASRNSEINIYAQDLSYGPTNIIGEQHRTGATWIDCVSGGTPTELRLSTHDDELGTMKAWFSKASGLVTYRDGTVGIPAEYALVVTVEHSPLGDGKDAHGDGPVYKNQWLMRPVSVEHDLSRTGHDLEAVPMAFIEIDPFMGTG